MQGITLWFTGLPCSGKTTIAKKLIRSIRQLGFFLEPFDEGLRVEHLDGDNIRRGLTADLGFSKEDRRKNLERVAFVAKLLTKHGVVVLCTFVSPYKDTRKWLKQEIGSFVEVYCDCSVEECIKRDVKGMYAKAIKGEIKEFTGISDPYEVPKKPDLVINTEKESEDDCVKKVLDYLVKKICDQEQQKLLSENHKLCKCT